MANRNTAPSTDYLLHEEGEMADRTRRPPPTTCSPRRGEMADRNTTPSTDYLLREEG